MHDHAKCIKEEISCMEFPVYYTKKRLNETGTPHLHKPTRREQKQLMECPDEIDVSEDSPVDMSLRDLVCSHAKCIQPEGESFEIEKNAAGEKLQAGASAEGKTNVYEAFNTGGLPSRKSVGTLSNQSMRKKNVSMQKKGSFPPWKPAGIAWNQSLRKGNPSEKKGGGFPSRKSVERALSQSMQKKNILEKKGEGTGSVNESLPYFGFESTDPEYRRCFFRCMSLSRNSDCESDESDSEGETYRCSEGEMGSVEWISRRDLVCSHARSIQPKGESFEVEEHAAEGKLQEAGAYTEGKTNVFGGLNTGGFPSRKSVGTLSNRSIGKKNVSMKKKGRFPPWKPAGIALNQSLRKENPSKKKGVGFPSRKSVKGALSQSMLKKNLLKKKVEGTDSEDEHPSYFVSGRNGVIGGPSGVGFSYPDSESEIEFETYSDSETERGSVEWVERRRLWAEKPWLVAPYAMSYL